MSFGVIPGSFQGHSGLIPGSFWGHSRLIPGSFWVILGSFPGRSRVIQDTFWGHLGHELGVLLGTRDWGLSGIVWGIRGD